MADLNSPITINDVIQKVNESSLPDQTGHTGEFLKSGSDGLEWDSVDALPNQTGNAGKSLYTDGVDASWEVTRDPNTYRSLSSAQATTLLTDGTYNGDVVTSGEIFTSADGSFKEFGDTQTPGVVKSTNPGSSYSDGAGVFYNSFKGWPFFYASGFRFTKTNGDSWLPAVHSDMYYFSYDDTTMYIYPYDINSTAGYKTTDAEHWISCTVAARPLARWASYYSAGYFIRCSEYTKAQAGAFIYTDNIESYWNTVTLPTGVSNYFILPFSDRLCILDQSTSKLYSTTDFQNWTDEGTSDVGDLTNSSCKAWVANEKVFVTLNTTSKFKVSSNYGKTFVEATMTAPASNYLSLVFCGYSKKNNIYVALNVTPYYSSYGNYYHTSVDGLNWTLINCSSTPYKYNSDAVCCGSDGVFSGANVGGGGAAFSIIETGVHHDYSLTPLSYNKASVDTALSDKQDTLTPGTGIDITGNVISVTGGGSSVTLPDIAIAGEGITFTTDTPVTGENFTKVGTPTITDKVVTSLDSSNYLAATGDGASFNVGNNPWEIKAKVSFDNTNDQAIFAAPNDMNNLVIGINGNKNFYLLATSNGYTWINWTTHTGSYTVQANTIYWIKAGYDGSNYYLKYSLDGETYIDDAFYTAGDKMRTAPLYIHAGWSQTFSGHLYLEEVSASIDGVVVWTPYVTSGTGKEIVSADADVISGYSFPATNHYTTETVTASGNTFTAPANGYYVARGTATSGGQYLELVGILDSLVQSFTNLDLAVTLPVLKGQTVTLNYNTNTPSLKFVYAEGAS